MSHSCHLNKDWIKIIFIECIGYTGACTYMSSSEAGFSEGDIMKTLK